jgi:hypothetical protein
LQNLDVESIRKALDTTAGTISRDVPCRFGPDLMRLVRVFATVEGICKSVSDNTFSYYDLIPTFATSLLLDDEWLLFKAKRDIASFLSKL